MAIGTPTVRGTATATTSSTTIVVTLSSGVSIGDVAFVVAGGRQASLPPTGAVDSRGNTWALDKTYDNTDGNNTLGLLSTPVTTALLASDTVTVTFAGSVGPSIEAVVFSCSGIATSSALDKTASCPATGFDLTLVTAFNAGTTSTLSSATELVVAGFVFGGAATPTAGSGYTALQYLASSGAVSGDRPIWVTYKVTAATTAVTPNGTIAATGNPPGGVGGLTATYRASGGDVTPPTVPTGLAVSGVTTPTGGGVSWNASTDAVGVTGYKVYLGGVLYRTITTGLFCHITGRSAATSYTVTVSAYDAAGNESAQSSGVAFVTSAANAQRGAVDPRPLAGVYRGAGQGGMNDVREWERWLGRPVKCALDFMPTDTWGSVELPFNAYWNGAASPFYANGGERMRMSITLVPDSNTGGATNPGTDPPTLAQAGTGTAGSGTYSPHWAKLVDFLVARNLYNVTFRPGNEFNGVWGLAWQPSTGGGTEAQFSAAYRDCVVSMRNRATAVGFAQTWKFEYSFATGDNGGGVLMDGAAYPGDDVWDVLSLNCYDEAYSGEDVETRWTNLLFSTPSSGGPGLNYARDFAAAKGKQLAFGEVGPVWHPSATNYSAPDTDAFLRHIFEWIADGDNRVAYWDWWDGSSTWVYRLLQRDPTVASKVLPRYQHTYHRLVSARPNGAAVQRWQSTGNQRVYAR